MKKLADISSFERLQRRSNVSDLAVFNGWDYENTETTYGIGVKYGDEVREDDDDSDLTADMYNLDAVARDITPAVIDGIKNTFTLEKIIKTEVARFYGGFESSCNKKFPIPIKDLVRRIRRYVYITYDAKGMN